jgi:hypothetical protein
MLTKQGTWLSTVLGQPYRAGRFACKSGEAKVRLPHDPTATRHALMAFIRPPSLPRAACFTGTTNHICGGRQMAREGTFRCPSAGGRGCAMAAREASAHSSPRSKREKQVHAYAAAAAVAHIGRKERGESASLGLQRIVHRVRLRGLGVGGRTRLWTTHGWQRQGSRNTHPDTSRSQWDEKQHAKRWSTMEGNSHANLVEQRHV